MFYNKQSCLFFKPFILLRPWPSSVTAHNIIASFLNSQLKKNLQMNNIASNSEWSNYNTGSFNLIREQDLRLRFLELVFVESLFLENKKKKVVF